MKNELSQAAKAARAEYLRKWRRKNPKKHKQHITTYWERKALEMQSGTDNLLNVSGTDKQTDNQLKQCAECGTLFNPKRSDARFCSTTCRTRMHKRRVVNHKN
jgi:hypothetical protein